MKPTCQQFVERITDCFEDALGPAERAGFADHAFGCDACQRHLEAARRAIDLTGTLSDDRVSGERMKPLLEMFGSWRSEHADEDVVDRE